MTRKHILKELEGIAQNFAVTVIYDQINGQGGYCWANNKHYIVINKSLSTNRKIELIVEGLVQFPLDEVYIKPKVREVINKIFPISKT